MDPVKQHVLVLPEVSVAVQQTVLVPNGKVDPLGGLQATVTPGQMSVAVAVKKVAAGPGVQAVGVVVVVQVQFRAVRVQLILAAAVAAVVQMLLIVTLLRVARVVRAL